MTDLNLNAYQEETYDKVIRFKYLNFLKDIVGLSLAYDHLQDPSHRMVLGIFWID